LIQREKKRIGSESHPPTLWGMGRKVLIYFRKRDESQIAWEGGKRKRMVFSDPENIGKVCFLTLASG
jgi:hypothetical protein